MGRIQQTTERDFEVKLNWFKKALYAPTKDLKAYEWLQQLAFRKDVHSFLLRWLENPKLKAGDFGIDDLLGMLVRNPVTDVAAMERTSWGLQPFSALFGVRVLANAEERVVSLWDRRHNPLYSFKFAASNSALFLVDLDAPNSTLLVQFESELKRARGTRRPVAHNPFATHRWFAIGLLPYIDLQIWALRHGIGEIPDAIMGRKILPEGRTGLEHRIGMVTKKNADRLLRMGTLAFVEKVHLMHAAIRY